MKGKSLLASGLNFFFNNLLMKHFVNQGFGWTCRRCQGNDEARSSEAGGRARFFREGEAEEREMKLSEPALARWRDDAREILVCPRCGMEENVKSEGISEKCQKIFE